MAVIGTGSASVQQPIRGSEPQQRIATPKVTHQDTTPKPVKHTPSDSQTSTVKIQAKRPSHPTNPLGVSFNKPQPKEPNPTGSVKAATVSETPKEHLSADQLIENLSKLSKSKPTGEPAYYKAITKILANPEQRTTLIKHFGLDSADNKEALKVAIFMEGGGATDKSKGNATLTGGVIMNRAIAIGLAKGNVSIAEVVKKPSQFAINNPKTMHDEKLKTFDEVMHSKKGKQYEGAMSSNVDAIATSVIGGEIGGKGTIYYGFKGHNGVNKPDTPKIPDRGTVNSWYERPTQHATTQHAKKS